MESGQGHPGAAFDGAGACGTPSTLRPRSPRLATGRRSQHSGQGGMGGQGGIARQGSSGWWGGWFGAERSARRDSRGRDSRGGRDGEALDELSLFEAAWEWLRPSAELREGTPSRGRRSLERQGPRQASGPSAVSTAV